MFLIDDKEFNNLKLNDSTLETDNFFLFSEIKISFINFQKTVIQYLLLGIILIYIAFLTFIKYKYQDVSSFSYILFVTFIKFMYVFLFMLILINMIIFIYGGENEVSMLTSYIILLLLAIISILNTKILPTA